MNSLKTTPPPVIQDEVEHDLKCEADYLSLAPETWDDSYRRTWAQLQAAQANKMYWRRLYLSSRSQSGREGRVVLVLEQRPDGGLRVYSDDVPGLILSGPEPSKVVRDIPTALEVLKVVRPTLAASPLPPDQHFSKGEI